MLVLYFCVILVNSLFSGSLASMPYTVYDMAQRGLCKARRLPLFENFLTHEKFELSNPENGIIFQQIWNASSFKRLAECKIYLQTPANMGLYINVNKAQLRRGSNKACIDSIEIKAEAKGYREKHKLCESRDAGGLKVISIKKGLVKITVHLDSSLPLSNIKDTLEVQFIATVKQKCGLPGYLPCEKDKEDSCISKDFFGDSVFNCPSCVDEDGCDEEAQPVKVNPSNVLLSAIVSLFATMMVFGVCLWCLYKYRRCIASCSSDNAGVARSNRESIAAVEQVQVELRTSSNDVRPSAPPDEEKDLPPSYDSLFPGPPSERQRL